MVVEGLKSSKFFCLISATSIDTEEFFRQSQIFTLLTPTVWKPLLLERFFEFWIWSFFMFLATTKTLYWNPKKQQDNQLFQTSIFKLESISQ